VENQAALGEALLCISPLLSCMRYIMSLLAIVLLVQYMTLPTVAVHVGLWSS